MTFQRKSLLSAYLVVAFLTFSLSEPILGSDKLALANLSQLTLAMIGLSVVKLSRMHYALLAFLVASMLLSGLYGMIFIGTKPRLEIYAFVMISVMNMMQIVAIAEEHERPSIAFLGAARTAIPWLLVIFAILGTAHYVLVGPLGITFGSDDKSHAAIYLGFLSFMSLLAFPAFGSLIGATFLLMGAMTISRLPYVFFLPFMIAALISLSNKGVPSKVRMAAFFVVAASIGGAIFMLLSRPDLFISLERTLNSIGGDAPSKSTIAHQALLRLGTEIRLDSFLNVIFGVSPGNFGGALIRSDLDYGDLAAVDPLFMEMAALDKAPIHSTHFAFVAEYPIWICVLYFIALAHIAVKLLQQRNWIPLLLFVPFNYSIMYYSAHNKAYYFLVMAFFILCARGHFKRPTRRKSRRATNPRRSSAPTFSNAGKEIIADWR